MSKVTHFGMAPRPRRQFMITVPEGTWSELTQLAEQEGGTPAEAFQAAVALLRLARDEASRGHVLAIATRDGAIVGEIVIQTRAPKQNHPDAS